MFSILPKKFKILLERNSDYTDKLGYNYKIQVLNFEFISKTCYILGFHGKETKYESKKVNDSFSYFVGLLQCVC